MDESCATNTLNLGHADWTLLGTADYQTELGAPQSWWSSESEMLARCLLVQETLSASAYQGQFTLINLSDESAFEACKTSNMVYNQTNPFKEELHFGIDPDDKAFS